MTAADGMDYQLASYRRKFDALPGIIAGWLGPYGGVDGKDVLDFGCGEATTALGMTRHHAPRSVLGVDIMPDVHLCLPLATLQLGLDCLPANLRLRQIEPGALDCPDGSFDLIYSWSVLEHVDRELLPLVLRDLHRLLRPGGHLFIQIAPLYYASNGSHLGAVVPEPWGHLTNQLDAYRRKLRAACPTEAAFAGLWSTFETLNRLTAPELVELVTASGFTILREHASSDGLEPPGTLLHAYDRAALTTEQIVLLAARDAPALPAPPPRQPRRPLARRMRRLAKRLLRRLRAPGRR